MVFYGLFAWHVLTTLFGGGHPRGTFGMGGGGMSQKQMCYEGILLVSDCGEGEDPKMQIFWRTSFTDGA